jgi:hypothetical protein
VYFQTYKSGVELLRIITNKFKGTLRTRDRLQLRYYVTHFLRRTHKIHEMLESGFPEGVTNPGSPELEKGLSTPLRTMVTKHG